MAVDIKEKSKYFAGAFVYIYEQTLTEYLQRLDNQIIKSGKFADAINGIVQGSAGATEVVDGGAKSAALLGFSFLTSVIASLGAKENRKNLKKIMGNLYEYKEDEKKVRKELVVAAVEIFYIFQVLFNEVTADGHNERALDKLAEDAVKRSIHYFMKNSKNLSAEEIAKGVLLGKSPSYKHTSTGIPHVTSGHTVLYQNHEVSTSDIFEKAGIAKDENGQIKVDKNGNKYGYRLALHWENHKNIFEELMGTPFELAFVMADKVGVVNELLEQLKEEDKGMVERFKQLIAELKLEAEKNFNEMVKCIADNKDSILEEVRALQQNKPDEELTKGAEQSTSLHNTGNMTNNNSPLIFGENKGVFHMTYNNK